MTGVMAVAAAAAAAAAVFVAGGGKMSGVFVIALCGRAKVELQGLGGSLCRLSAGSREAQSLLGEPSLPP